MRRGAAPARPRGRRRPRRRRRRRRDRDAASTPAIRAARAHGSSRAHIRDRCSREQAHVTRRSPRARPAVAGLARDGAQRAADARVQFELAAEQPQQVGEAIEIREDRRLHGLARFDSRTTPRSARRQMVRAMSNAAAAVCSPETDQSDTMPSSASRRCTSAVRRSTISCPIGTCGFGLCGGVAIADPTLNSSRCTECANALMSASSQIERAKPSVEISSSTLP